MHMQLRGDRLEFSRLEGAWTCHGGQDNKYLLEFMTPSEPSSDLSLWFHIVSRLKRRCDDLREELMGTCPFYPRGEMTSG